MTTFQDLEPFKTTITKLANELAHLIRPDQNFSWSFGPPKLGTHFGYHDIESLPSFQPCIEKLRKIDEVNVKYSSKATYHPILRFLESCLASGPDPSGVQNAIDFFWQPFSNFLLSGEVPIRLLIALSNFQSDTDDFQITPEVRIRYFGKRSLSDVMPALVSLWPGATYPDPAPSLFDCHGTIQIDFTMPANQQTLEYHQYSRECIERIRPISEALRLASFGRPIIGPWIPICNPSFPIDSVSFISGLQFPYPFEEPIFHLDSSARSRLSDLYQLIMRIDREDEQKMEFGRAGRRRLKASIHRFNETFDQGVWESVVVDFVILMESLLTPDKQGGRMPLAVAASNLLATSDADARELYENINRLYRIRNDYVHGEPTTQEEWDKSLLEIVREAGSSALDLENGTRHHAFEIARDYVRRAISSALNLYCAGRPPSTALSRDLHRLHLNPALKAETQAMAKAYSLSDRPPVP